MSLKTPKLVVRLEQNYPNPFKNKTTIFYTIALAESSKISLKIFEEGSQNEVKTLVNQIQKKGHYEVKWDGTNERGEGVSSGTYVCKLRLGNFQQSIKMILSR